MYYYYSIHAYIIVAAKTTARKYSPRTHITTKRDIILRGSCFCEKYSTHMHRRITSTVLCYRSNKCVVFLYFIYSWPTKILSSHFVSLNMPYPSDYAGGSRSTYPATDIEYTKGKGNKDNIIVEHNRYRKDKQRNS